MIKNKFAMKHQCPQCKGFTQITTADRLMAHRLDGTACYGKAVGERCNKCGWRRRPTIAASVLAYYAREAAQGRVALAL